MPYRIVKSMKICINCVNLESLKKYIKKKRNKAICSYCGANDFCVKDVQLYNLLKMRFKECLVKIDDLSDFEQGIILECGSDNPHVQDIWGWIECFDIGTEQVVSDFYACIDDSSKLYALNDGTLEYNEYESNWEVLTSKIFYNQRFFNENIEQFLDSLFQYLNIKPKSQNSLIKTIDIKDKIFRARIANTPDVLNKIEKEPHKQLGVVPKNIAESQRMTPHGISALYASFDRTTCLSEIRAVAGDIVVSGAFAPLKTLKLLDLNSFKNLKDDTHPLTEGFSNKQQAIEFLRTLINKLSIPRRSEDAFTYLTSQIFFEYIKMKYNNIIDGLIYPSVQTGLQGQNIILFPDKSKIAPSDYIFKEFDEFELFLCELEGNDSFPPTLRFIEKSLIFHKITAVNTQSEEHDSPISFTLDPLTKKRLNI
jgi:hypothetical protein